MEINKTTARYVRKALDNWQKRLDVMIYSELDEDGMMVFSVNWKAMGGQEPKKAEEYGNSLIKAAQLATTLNEMEIKVNDEYAWVSEEEENADMRNLGYILVELM